MSVCYRVVRVRETRLTAIFSHILIGLSILILRYLTVIPTAVLYGLFLYVAVTALYDNQFFERILLYITEQVRHTTWCREDLLRLTKLKNGKWVKSKTNNRKELKL